MALACPYCAAPYEFSYIPSEISLAACAGCMNPYAISPESGQAAAKMLPGRLDIRQTVPPDSLGGRSLASVQKNLDTLPVLPEIARRVMALCNDPDVSIADLATLLSQDSAMAGKVLQVANSAMYGGLKSITSLDAACARLGLRNTANIVQAVVNARMFESSDSALNGAMKRLWRHSIVAAQSAYEVARLGSEPQPDSRYLAALFHDVGHTAMIDRVSRGKDPVMAQLRSAPELLREVLESFGRLVGLHCIQRWGLGTPFRVAAFYANQPETALEPWLRAAHTAAMASALADVMGYGEDEAPRHDGALVGLPSASYLGLSDIKIAGLRVDLEDKLAEWVQLLAA